MDRLIHTVGQHHLVWREPEVLRHRALHPFALGILRKLFRCDLPNALKHPGRNRKRVLVEVQPQRIAAGQRRMVLRHHQHRTPRNNSGNVWRSHHTVTGDLGCTHSFILTRTLSACAVRPSASARAIAFGPSSFNPACVYSWTVITFTKSSTLNPPRTRPTRPV